MQFRALRPWGALLLIALAVVPATMAAAATTRHQPRSTSAKSAAARPKAGVRRPAHAARGTASRGTLASRRARGTRHGHARLRAQRPPHGVVYARNAIVVDPATDKVLFEKESGQTVPIASLTKLLSALVFLDQKPDLRRTVEVTADELHGGGHTQLRRHEQVALYDLLHMSLMNSDNVATRVLARESGLPADEFVVQMNAKARTLGMKDSHFAEPTGLSSDNVSTAADVAKLLRAAADHYLIREVTTTPSYVFVSAKPVRQHQIVNTNRLLRANRYEFNCSKTGFISQSGYCLATWVRDQGRDLIAVVLGAPTNATRFADVVRLVQRTETLSVAP